MQQLPDDLQAIGHELSAAADFLLPVAQASDWSSRLEIVAWLTAVRETFKDKNDSHLH